MDDILIKIYVSEPYLGCEKKLMVKKNLPK